MLEKLPVVRAKAGREMKEQISLRSVDPHNVIAMPRRDDDRPRRSQRVEPRILPDDLYDYIPQDDSETPVARIGRPLKHDVGSWTVTDDWPECVPVTEAEIDLFEAYFGDILDEIFSKSG